MTVQILYTDTDKIRSVIGLDDSDISDDIIAGQLLDLAMMERLQDVMPDYEAQYDADSVGLIQNRLTLWCTFYGAQQVIKNCKLAIPIKFQADTDTIARFTMDLAKLEPGIDEKVGWLEARLNPAYSYAINYPKIMGSAAPDYNPTDGPDGDREYSLLAMLLTGVLRPPVNIGGL